MSIELGKYNTLEVVKEVDFGLYLDGGEDAELAEALARQSVALRPDRRAAWLELARALEVQGREREARDARIRAAEV